MLHYVRLEVAEAKSGLFTLRPIVASNLNERALLICGW